MLHWIEPRMALWSIPVHWPNSRQVLRATLWSFERASFITRRNSKIIRKNPIWRTRRNPVIRHSGTQPKTLDISKVAAETALCPCWLLVGAFLGRRLRQHLRRGFQATLDAALHQPGSVLIELDKDPVEPGSHRLPFALEQRVQRVFGHHFRPHRPPG